jgi:hypothetical protein
MSHEALFSGEKIKISSLLDYVYLIKPLHVWGLEAFDKSLLIEQIQGFKQRMILPGKGFLKVREWLDEVQFIQQIKFCVTHDSQFSG